MKTWDLIISAFHKDGIKRAHRAKFSTAEIRDKEANDVLEAYKAGSNIIVGPDATTEHQALCLSFDDLQALHVRIENPPEPPRAVAFEGKDYVPIEDESGARVLWPAAWFRETRKEALPAAAVN
jgi:hypothetical protein